MGKNSGKLNRRLAVRALALMLALLFAMPSFATMEDLPDLPIAPDAAEMAIEPTNATKADAEAEPADDAPEAGEASPEPDDDIDDITVPEADDAPPELSGEIWLDDLALGALSANEEQLPQEESGDVAPTGFCETAEVGGGRVTVTALPGSFPAGATLRASKSDDEAVARLCEAALEAEACTHRLYSIEVLDAAGNAILPNYDMELPTVRVDGIDPAGDTRVFYYDWVEQAVFELAATADGSAVEFAFRDSAVYDVVTLPVNDTAEPTDAPTAEPSAEPTEEPTVEPTTEPTGEPTAEPTAEPVGEPIEEPTVELMEESVAEPTVEPAVEPSEEPTEKPTEAPIAEPTEEPTTEPTEEPTPAPTVEPTEEPTAEPTVEPTIEPTTEPTPEPTAEPTEVPVAYPAQRFADAAEGVSVQVEAPEGAFPEGTTLRVTPVWDDTTLSDIETAVSGDFVEVKRIHAVDITFLDADGAEIEPRVPISVVLTLEEMARRQEAVVVHVDDEGNAAVVERTGAPEVAFEAESFSVYALVVTEAVEQVVKASDGRDYRITVAYNPDAGIPDGATLSVAEITDADARAAYEAEAAAAMGIRASSIGYGRLFDITILSDGEAVQPRAGATVDVRVTLADADGADVSVVHFARAPESVEADTYGDTVAFTTGGFSVYGFFTVDFWYGEYEYHLPGEGEILLSELFALLGIEDSAANAREVTFTAPQYLSIQQLEDDWKLTSLAPFNTEETLTVKFADGEISVRVTDAAQRKTITFAVSPAGWGAIRKGSDWYTTDSKDMTASNQGVGVINPSWTNWYSATNNNASNTRIEYLFAAWIYNGHLYTEYVTYNTSTYGVNAFVDDNITDGSTLIAHFYPKAATVILFDTEDGTSDKGTVSSNVYFFGSSEDGNAVNVLPTATPKAGYIFDGWYVNDSQISTEAQLPYSAVSSLTSNTTVTAKFEKDQSIHFNVHVNNSAWGDVTYGNPPQTYVRDNIQSNASGGLKNTITARPADGYEFKYWDIDGTKLDATVYGATLSSGPALPGMVDGSTLTAIFMPAGTDYVVHYTTDGNGTVDVETGYYSASNSSLLEASTATADSTHVFEGWYDESDNKVSDLATYKPDVVTAEVTYTAKFRAKVQYDITYVASPTAGGTLSADQESVFEGNTALGATATATAGYQFVHWIDESGNEVFAEATYAPTNVQANATYTAVFERIGTCYFEVAEGNGSFYKVQSAGTGDSHNTEHLTSPATRTFTTTNGMNNTVLVVPDTSYYLEKIEVYKGHGDGATYVETLSQNPVLGSYMRGIDSTDDYTFKAYFAQKTLPVTVEGRGTVSASSVNVVSGNTVDFDSYNTGNIDDQDKYMLAVGTAELDAALTATLDAATAQACQFDGWYAVGENGEETQLTTETTLPKTAIRNHLDATKIVAKFSVKPEYVIVNYAVYDEGKNEATVTVGGTTVHTNDNPITVVVPVGNYASAADATAGKGGLGGNFIGPVWLDGNGASVSIENSLKLSEAYTAEQFAALGGTELLLTANYTTKYTFNVLFEVQDTAGTTTYNQDSWVSAGKGTVDQWAQFDVVSHGASVVGKSQLSKWDEIEKTAGDTPLMRTNLTYDVRFPSGWYIDHWEYRDGASGSFTTVLTHEHTLPNSYSAIAITQSGGAIKAVFKPVTFSVLYEVYEGGGDVRAQTPSQDEGKLVSTANGYAEYFTTPFTEGQTVDTVNMSAGADSGYQLVGWFVDTDLESVVAGKQGVTIKHDFTLTRDGTRFNLYYDGTDTKSRNCIGPVPTNTAGIGRNLVTGFDANPTYYSDITSYTFYVFFHQAYKYYFRLGSQKVNLPDGETVVNYSSDPDAGNSDKVSDNRYVGIITENDPGAYLEAKNTAADKQFTIRSDPKSSMWGSMHQTMYAVPAPGYQFVRWDYDFVEGALDYLADNSPVQNGYLKRYSQENLDRTVNTILNYLNEKTDNLYKDNESDANGFYDVARNVTIGQTRMSPLSDGIITAIFTPRTCTLHYMDGSTEYTDKKDSEEFTHQTGYVYNVNYTPTKEGYVFIGWSTSQNATAADAKFEAPKLAGGVEYIYGENTMSMWNDTDEYLYAVFEPLPSLTISKTVTGGMGDRTRDFTFTLTVAGGDNETYSTVRTDASGTATNGTLTLANGAQTFTLKHGESMKIQYFAGGSQVTVTEDNDNYTTTWRFHPDTGNTSEDASATGNSISFTLAQGQQDNTLAVTNNLEPVSPTGVRARNGPYLLMLLLAVVMLAARRRRGHRKRGGADG